MTNSDVVEGKLKQVQGRAQDAKGDVTDDPADDIAGKARKVEGKIQEGIGHLREDANDDKNA